MIPYIKKNDPNSFATLTQIIKKADKKGIFNNFKVITVHAQS